MDFNILENQSSTSLPILQKAISILLQYVSIVEGLFTIPVSEEVALETWTNTFTNPNAVNFGRTIKERDLHHLAAAIILKFKKLNGSLLTSKLHDRFIAAAAISNKYSQIYVFRLLLGNLPPVNYAVLKNLSLLLRCITFKNTSKVSEQVIVTFGGVLLRNRDDLLFIHRQLTATDAGTLFVVVLIEEWNYLFQYGRVSFHNSLPKVDSNATHSPIPCEQASHNIQEVLRRSKFSDRGLSEERTTIFGEVNKADMHERTDYQSATTHDDLQLCESSPIICSALNDLKFSNQAGWRRHGPLICNGAEIANTSFHNGSAARLCFHPVNLFTQLHDRPCPFKQSGTENPLSSIQPSKDVNHESTLDDIDFAARQSKELKYSLGLSNDCLKRLQKFVVNVSKAKDVEESALKAAVNQLLLADFGTSTVGGLVSEQFELKRKGEQEQHSWSTVGNNNISASCFLKREEEAGTAEQCSIVVDSYRQDTIKPHESCTKLQKYGMRGRYFSENNQGLQLLLASDELAGCRGFYTASMSGGCISSGGAQCLSENAERKTSQISADTCYSSFNRLFETNVERTPGLSCSSDGKYQAKPEPTAIGNVVPKSIGSLPASSSHDESIFQEDFQSQSSNSDANKRIPHNSPEIYGKMKVNSSSIPMSTGPGKGVLDLCVDTNTPPVMNSRTALSVQNLKSVPVSLAPGTLVPDSNRPLVYSPPVTLSPSPPPPPKLSSQTPSVPSTSLPPPPPPPPKLSSQPPSLPPPAPPPLPKPPLAPPPPPPLKKLGSLASPDITKEVAAHQDKRPKMKQLVWDKITGVMAEQTVWKTATLSAVQMDLEELESLFSLKDITTESDIPKKRVTSARKKDQGVQVLDHKRAHNVGIQLRSLRKPALELCQALRDKDLRILNMEVLNVMSNTLPSEDDLLLLKSYRGDHSDLAEVEKYYLDLSTIPRYDKLIKAFIFKGQYILNYCQIQQELNLLERACDELKDSQNFLKILEMVLAVGNHLNGGSFRGAARGFRLGALLKLMDVKSHKKKTTLLHFVVAELLRTDEKVGKLAEELKSVKTAANLSLERLQSGLKELENGVELIKSEVVQPSSDVGDSEKDLRKSDEQQQLVEILSPFYEKAELEVSTLRNLYTTTLVKLKDLVVYYGETLKEERMIELFKTMREFMFMFDQVNTELKETRRREDEVANKRTTFFSCPSSPAMGPRLDAFTMKDPGSLTTTFHLVPSAPQLEDDVKTENSKSTSVDKNQSFPGLKTATSTPAAGGDDLKNEENHLSTSANTEMKTISPGQRIDNTEDNEDPHFSNNVSYDSDWSTG